MSAWFMVRAKLVDVADRAGFDRWYGEEHLPDARKSFAARRAWRGWSDIDPLLHYAVYEFDNLEQVRALPGSDAMQRLVAEFDRVWGAKVQRERDRVEIVQDFAGA